MKILQIVLIIGIAGVLVLFGVELSSNTTYSAEDYKAVRLTNQKFNLLIEEFLNKEIRNIYSIAYKRTTICPNTNEKQDLILRRARTMRLHMLDTYTATKQLLSQLGDSENPEKTISLHNDSLISFQNAIERYVNNMNRLFPGNEAVVVSPLPLRLGKKDYPLTSLQDAPWAIWDAARLIIVSSLIETERFYSFAMVEALTCDKNFRLMPIVQTVPSSRKISKNGVLEAEIFLSHDHMPQRLEVRADVGTLLYENDSTKVVLSIPTNQLALSFDADGKATQRITTTVRVPDMTKYHEFVIEKSFVVQKKK